MAQHGPRVRAAPARVPAPSRAARRGRHRAVPTAGAARHSFTMGRTRAACATVDRLVNRFWDYPRWLRSADGRLRSLSHRRSQLRAPDGGAAARPHAGDVPRPRCLRGGAARREPPLAAGPRHGAPADRGRPARRPGRLRLARHARRARGSRDRRRRRASSSCRTACIPTCTPRARPPGRRGGRRRCSGPPDPEVPEILHVGSVIPRKRIDVLLDVFAAICARATRARASSGWAVR